MTTGLAAGGFLLRRLVAFPDDAQALERELVVDFADEPRMFADERAQAAAGDDFGVLAQRAENALEKPVDEAEIPVEQSRLDAGESVGADNASGILDLDAGQARGAREKCVGGD